MSDRISASRSTVSATLRETAKAIRSVRENKVLNYTVGAHRRVPLQCYAPGRLLICKSLRTGTSALGLLFLLLSSNAVAASGQSNSISTQAQPGLMHMASTVCAPNTTGDFRVASGTVSNRWVYEIWNSTGAFYTRYWRQSQTCQQAYITSRYPSQQEAYRAFRAIATSNESRGNLSR